MSLEEFQLLDKEPFDNSIVKRDFQKVYHQPGANLHDLDQHVEFIFGENHNYHQTGNCCFQNDITVQNLAAVFDNSSRIRLTINELAYVFQEAILATTSGSNLEHDKFVGQTSTIIRVLTSKDGDFLSQLDNIHEGNADANFVTTSLEKVLLNDHVDADKGKIEGQLPLQQILVFVKLLKK